MEKAVYEVDKMFSDRSCNVLEGDQGCGSVNPIGDDIVALVAAWYSSTAKITGMLATIHNKAMIGGGQTSDDLSDKRNFPNFMRVISPDRYQAPYLAATTKKFGWENVAVVWAEEPYGAGLAKNYIEACDTFNIEVRVALSFSVNAIYKGVIHQTFKCYPQLQMLTTS